MCLHSNPCRGVGLNGSVFFSVAFFTPTPLDSNMLVFFVLCISAGSILAELKSHRELCIMRVFLVDIRYTAVYSVHN